MTKPRRAAKPSERLDAHRPQADATGGPAEAVAGGEGDAEQASDAAEVSMSMVVDRDERLAMLPTRMRVATKFVVVDKAEVPVVVGRELLTRHHVKLRAAYEARSIHNGLATEQGNADNRVFGAGEPEAVIAMVIESKAIADTFVTGRAFEVVFTEIV